jgi:chitinase
MMRIRLAALIWLGSTAAGCTTHADPHPALQLGAAGSRSGLDAGAAGATQPARNDAGSSAGAAAKAGAAVSGRSGSVGGAGAGGSSDDGDASAADSGEPASRRSGFVFSPYKDTSIDLNWNTNVITTKVSGEALAITSDFAQNHGHAMTVAFATGECGSETWGGVAGATLAASNLPALETAGVQYIVSTGGAAGTFTCGSDAGMNAFLERWDSPGLIGVDFDIEAGQSQAVILDLIARAKAAHVNHPGLRFSLTLATLATSEAGASSARSLGSAAQDSLNSYGVQTLNAVKTVLGFSGESSTWPSYLTVNLMTMDYGAAGAGICVVSGSSCQMGQSTIQAAYNLHDHWGVPYANIELTPMIGGNDVSSEQFTLDDVDTISRFALSSGLAGLHYWSYDRDRDCPSGSAAPTCNSLGTAGTYGFLKRFLSALPD